MPLQTENCSPAFAVGDWVFYRRDPLYMEVPIREQLHHIGRVMEAAEPGASYVLIDFIFSRAPLPMRMQNEHNNTFNYNGENHYRAIHIPEDIRQLLPEVISVEEVHEEWRRACIRYDEFISEYMGYAAHYMEQRIEQLQDTSDSDMWIELDRFD